jgi:cobalt-zinc-cadmium efflux system outer membrane protein
MVHLRRIVLSISLGLGIPVAASGQQRFTLQDLLTLGRERSPAILALQAEHAAAEAQRRDAGRWENPELEYEWGSGDPREGGPNQSLSGLSARQVLENPLTRHYRLGALRAEVDAAAEEVRSGTLDVELEVRTHFYRILYLREIVRLARLNEEALGEIRALIETRARVGEVRELEAIRLRVEYLRARNEVEKAEMELDQHRRHLNTFLGNVLPDDFTLDGSLTAEPEEPDLERMTRELLPRHPELVRAAKATEAARATLKERQLGWLPDPVLSGSSRRELDGDVRSLGIGLRIPLWNQSRAAADEGRQRVRMMEHLEEAVRLDLEANLLIHHNQLRLDRRTLQLFEDGLLEEAETSMDIAETSYRQGEISFMDYLDARRTYHSIQIQRQQALLDWNVERATLDRAAGGGTL